MSLAMVFPGQGSQYIGMLASMPMQHPEVKTVFDEASSVLNYDLWDLTQTEHSQPALLAASFAVWEILNKKPELIAGYSLGEYTALVCANARMRSR